MNHHGVRVDWGKASVLELGSVDRCAGWIYIAETAKICHCGFADQSSPLARESCDFREDDLDAVSANCAGWRNDLLLPGYGLR
jgi:hypothetical protein